MAASLYSPAWKILTCLFSFLIFLLILCPPLNNSHYPVIYALRKEEYHINMFFSILKRTRSPFLGIENFLLVSETAMNLCILLFLSRRFWFIKNQNKKKPYTEERLFLVTPSVSKIPKISDSINFSGSSFRQIKCLGRSFSFTWTEYF